MTPHSNPQQPSCGEFTPRRSPTRSQYAALGRSLFRQWTTHRRLWGYRPAAIGRSGYLLPDEPSVWLDGGLTDWLETLTGGLTDAFGRPPEYPPLFSTVGWVTFLLSGIDRLLPRIIRMAG